MSPQLVLIAGGSGAGKSTLAYGLQDLYSDITVIHFDDYQKSQEQVPIEFGMKNWDCPEAINFERLKKDLHSLLAGQQVEVMTKSRKYNPEYEQKGRIPHTITPTGVLILEGYMSLFDENIRSRAHASVFLDIDDDKRVERRDKDVNEDKDAYNKKILIPGHKKYIEPTKKYADIIIDTGICSQEEVHKKAVNFLKEKSILRFS